MVLAECIRQLTKFRHPAIETEGLPVLARGAQSICGAFYILARGCFERKIELAGAWITRL